MNSPLTVQSVIDALKAKAQSRLPENGVDGLLIGRPDTQVTGIVTTFMPTLSIAEQAARLGANFVIGHEGLFFSHRQRPERSPENGIERIKRQRIEELDIAVFRFHDGIHRFSPDGIADGWVEKLGWSAFVREHRPETVLLHIPPAPLRTIAARIKSRLELDYVRAVGNPDAVFSRAALLVGYRGGGALAVPLLESGEAELIIYGEGPEWETPEYVREAVRSGRNCGLIAIGHAESEEPGMEKLARLLSEMFPGLPVRHIREEALFRIM